MTEMTSADIQAASTHITPPEVISDPLTESNEPLIDRPMPLEKEKAVEVSHERRMQEAKMVVDVTLSRIFHECKGKKETDLTASERAISGYIGLNALKNYSDGQTLSQPIPVAGQGTELRFTFLNGEYLPTPTGGQQIVSINNTVPSEPGYFYCQLAGANDQKKIHIDQLIQAQLLAEKGTIIAGIKNPNQKVLLNQYLHDTVQGQDQPQLTDEQIKLAAQETGLFTTTSGERYILTQTEKNSDLQNNLLDVIKGKNILDLEDITQIVSQTNDISLVINKNLQIISTLDTEISSLQTALNQTTDENTRKSLTAQISQYESQKSQQIAANAKLEPLQALFGSRSTNEAVKDSLKQFYDGTGSIENAQTVAKSLEAGDQRALIQDLLGKIKDPAKRAEFQKLSDAFVAVGGMSLILLAVMVMEGMKESK